MCDLETIIANCQKGDPKAGAELYRMFAPKMFAICIRYSKSREEAEDNLQDGFIKMLEVIRQYSGKGSFEGWMKRIFVTTALEKFRKNSPLQLVEELPDQQADEEQEDDRVDVPGEVLLEFIRQLPEKYRMVFNLYVMEQLPHKEIAQVLGISEGTSKSNLARAKDILKRKVKEYRENE